MKNQHLVFKTFNLACVFGWENKYIKCDVLASIVMRTIALIAAALGAELHVVHVPRGSSWENVLVDNLSKKVDVFSIRKSTSKKI
jgi:hypothetical protein